MNPTIFARRSEDGRLLLNKASLVANLHEWSGNFTKARHQWLSAEDILLWGDDDSNGGRREENAKKRVVYRLRVADDLRRKGAAIDSRLPNRYKPEALPRLSQRLQAFYWPGEGTISPDGRWYLAVERRDLTEWKGIRDSQGGNVMFESYWRAFAVDGSRDVAWPVKMRSLPTGGIGSMAAVFCTNATWLPDSSGILETYVDGDKEDQKSATINGQIRLLNSPAADPHPLPPVRLSLSPDTDQWQSPWAPANSLWMTTPRGRTIALRQACLEQCHEADWLDRSPDGIQGNGIPDHVTLYSWDWQAQNTPRVHASTSELPGSYHAFQSAISHHGDRIAWAVMDRAHHAVVASGYQLPSRIRAGTIGLWVSDISRGRIPAIREAREIGHIPIPTGKEQWYWGNFALGDWVPGDRRVSFLMENMLYTVPV